MSSENNRLVALVAKVDPVITGTQNVAIDHTVFGSDLADYQTAEFIRTLNDYSNDYSENGRNFLDRIDDCAEHVIGKIRSDYASMPVNLQGKYRAAIDKLKGMAAGPLRGVPSAGARWLYGVLATVFGSFQVGAIVHTGDIIFRSLTLAAMLRTVTMYAGTLKSQTFGRSRAMDLGWQRSVVNSPIIMASLALDPKRPDVKPVGYLPTTSSLTVMLIGGYICLKLRDRFSGPKLTLDTLKWLASDDVPDNQLNALVAGTEQSGMQLRYFADTLVELKSQYKLHADAKASVEELIGSLTVLANGLTRTYVSSNRLPEQNVLTGFGAGYSAATVYLTASQPSAALSFATWSSFFVFRLDDVAQKPGSDIDSSVEQFTQAGGLSMVFTPWLIALYLNEHTNLPFNEAVFEGTVQAIPAAINVTVIGKLAPIIVGGWKKSAGGRKMLGSAATKGGKALASGGELVASGLQVEKWLIPVARFVLTTASPAMRPLAQAYVKMLRAVGARDTDKAREFADRIRQRQEGLQELPSDINPADVALVVMERSANGNGQEDRGVQAFRAALEELEEDVMPLIEEYLGGNQGQEQLDYMSNLTFGGRSFDIPATHGPVAWVKVATMLWEMFSGFNEADDEKEE